jgi:hypothetical protein
MPRFHQIVCYLLCKRLGSPVFYILAENFKWYTLRKILNKKTQHCLRDQAQPSGTLNSKIWSQCVIKSSWSLECLLVTQISWQNAWYFYFIYLTHDVKLLVAKRVRQAIGWSCHQCKKNARFTVRARHVTSPRKQFSDVWPGHLIHIAHGIGFWTGRIFLVRRRPKRLVGAFWVGCVNFNLKVTGDRAKNQFSVHTFCCIRHTFLFFRFSNSYRDHPKLLTCRVRLSPRYLVV